MLQALLSVEIPIRTCGAYKTLILECVAFHTGYKLNSYNLIFLLHFFDVFECFCPVFDFEISRSDV